MRKIFIWKKISILALLLYMSVGQAAFAIDENKEIVIGLSSKPLTVDPHYDNSQPGFNLAWQIYEPLITINQYTNEIENLLAKKVELEAPKTWSVVIQDNIYFHDGSLLTIDDIIYSIDRVQHHPDIEKSPNSMSHYARGIISLEKISPNSMKIHTDTDNLNILPGLGRIFIVKKPRDVASANKDSFDSGKNSIGSGPYSFGGYNKDGDIILNRFDRFHTVPAYFKHGRLRFIKDRKERISEFTKGGIHLLEKLTIDEAKQINQNHDYMITKTNTHRLIFLNVNARTSTHEIYDTSSGQLLKENPFSKLKVRQALSMGIDRGDLTNRVLQQSGKIASQYVLPEVSSYSPEIKEQTYHPDEARQLLTEAGYPNGFTIPIYGPNDRYMNDAAMLEAIAEMLKKIGIVAIPHPQPKSVFFAEEVKHELTFRGYSTNGQELEMLNTLVRTKNEANDSGSYNFSGYSNPKVDKLLEQADSSLSPAVQRSYIRRATEISLKELAIIPLYFEPSIWIMSKDIEYWHNPNERTLLQYVRPVK